MSKRSSLNLAFFHDSRFKRDSKGRYYTTGSLSRELFETRYLSIFNNMTVVAREERVNDKAASTLVLSSHKKIKFACTPKLNLLSLIFGKDGVLIRQAVRDTDFSIIRMPSVIGIFAFLAARKYKKPFLVEMVGCPFDSLWSYGKIHYRFFAVLLYEVNKYILRRSPYVLYVTDEFLQNRYPTTGKSIGCSDVVINDIKPTVMTERQERLNNMNNGQIIIGTIANVAVRFKGQRYVIAALSRLVEAGYDVEYQLVGGGNPAYLKKLAEISGVSNRIKFIGVLKHDEVLQWLDDVDIYAQLSLQEGLPRSVVEAMSRGCVCIGARTGGIPELLNKEYVVPRKDSVQIEQMIKTLLGDNALMLDASKRNMKKAKQYTRKELDTKRRLFLEDVIAELS